MRRVYNLLQLYSKEKEILEAEYRRRWGDDPGEVDDNFWIDSFHYPGAEFPSLEQVEKSALDHAGGDPLSGIPT